MNRTADDEIVGAGGDGLCRRGGSCVIVHIFTGGAHARRHDQEARADLWSQYARFFTRRHDAVASDLCREQGARGHQFVDCVLYPHFPQVMTVEIRQHGHGKKLQRRIAASFDCSRQGFAIGMDREKLNPH